MAEEQGKNLSVGGQQQLQDSPPKLIDNAPAPTVAGALANAKEQVDSAK